MAETPPPESAESEVTGRSKGRADADGPSSEPARANGAHSESTPSEHGAGKLLICPYCGDAQPPRDRCRSCAGLFEPLSRQATHNSMGPWFVRNPQRPFQPGCSYETLKRLVQRGQVTRLTIVRGPTTRQFWTIAKRVPGIAHLLGYCHDCGASVDPGDHGCHACGVTFGAFLDRNFLGLPEYRPLPGEHEPMSGLRDEGARTWRGLPTIREIGGSDAANIGHGLSSFATDEELRSDGAAPPPMSHAQQAPQSSPMLDVVSEEEMREPVSPAGDDAELRMGIMERRLARQQRSVYRLTVAAAALAVFALVALIGWITASMTTNSASTADVEDAGPAGAVPPAAPAPAAASAAQEPAEADEFDLAEPPKIRDESAEHDEPLPPGEPTEAVRSMHERAMHLLDQARDEEHNLPDRIEDCEEAIAILTSIADDQPRSTWPANLSEQLDEARRLLDQLKLQQFFP